MCIQLARSFNFTFRYIDDVLSLNNSSFGDFVDSIYPIELEIKDTTDTDMSASYLDLKLEIDSEGRLRTKLYDKRRDFNFPIVNCISSLTHIKNQRLSVVYLSDQPDTKNTYIAMFVNGLKRNEQSSQRTSIDSSYQVSVHLAKQFQRRRFLEID